ncbi:putative Xylulose kinase [Streptomyces misionensis JCM 4497]
MRVRVEAHGRLDQLPVERGTARGEARRPGPRRLRTPATRTYGRAPGFAAGGPSVCEGADRGSERAQLHDRQQRDQLDRRRAQRPGPGQVVGAGHHQGEQGARAEPGRPAEYLHEAGVAAEEHGEDQAGRVREGRDQHGQAHRGLPGAVAAELAGQGVGDHAQHEQAEHHHDRRDQHDRHRVGQRRADGLLAGVVEAEHGEQAVQEGHDQGRAPHRVVPHPQEGLVGGEDDAPQQLLPVQRRARRRGRRGGTGLVGRALGVRGGLVDREGLGVPRVVGRVRVRRAVAVARVAVVEVLRAVVRLALVAVRRPPALLRVRCVPVRRLRRLRCRRVAVRGARGPPRALPVRGARALPVRLPVLTLLPVRRRPPPPARRAGPPARRAGPAVRRALRRLLSLGGAVVLAPTSDPESSHVIERTWSRRAACRARVSGPGIAADL